MTYATYRSALLGRYIDKHLTWADGAKARTFAAKSGTIKGKVEFARSVCEHQKTLDDLSPEAIEIGKKLVQHILKHNPHLRPSTV